MTARETLVSSLSRDPPCPRHDGACDCDRDEFAVVAAMARLCFSAARFTLAFDRDGFRQGHALEVARAAARGLEEMTRYRLALLIGPERSEGPFVAPRRHPANDPRAVTPETTPANGGFSSSEAATGPNGAARLDEGDGR